MRTAVLDVRTPDHVKTLAAQLAERHDGIDVVIANAAARITPERPASEQAAAERWPDHINIPSKVGQVAAARIFAREVRSNEEERRLIAGGVPRAHRYRSFPHVVR